MSNDFVEYLNSMNNANSKNENALAESQVTNPYFGKVKVNRKIGDNIYKKLLDRDENACVFLTGHAGDGKTSILIQLLEKLGYFNCGIKPLLEKELYDNKFFYVKDMSELNQQKQEEALVEALKSPKKGLSSFLISNTGPLLNTFKRLIEKSLINDGVKDDSKLEEEKIKFEIKLLRGIEKVKSEDDVNIYGENLKFTIYNIANIDNTYFINEIMEKVCNEELWIKCKNCESQLKCPVFFNYCTLTSHKNHISKFLSYLYFWLNEKGQRLTIRQMLSHITYAITGNLVCDYVKRKVKESEGIDYQFIFENSFPNLLFGYKGLKVDKKAQNIRAIQELNNLGVDQQTISGDYELFVRENFDIFEEPIKNVVENIYDYESEELGLFKQSDNPLKRAMRRFYMIYLKMNDRQFDELLSEIYSPVYRSYFNLISKGKISHLEKKNIIDIIFKGLYKTYVGASPLTNDTKLYLTVKKSFYDIQNVQMIQAEIDLDEISLKTVKNEELVEKSYKKYLPKISFSGEEMELKLGMLDFLYKIQNGKLITSLEPNYSFDLTNWRSRLSRKFKFEADNQIRLLIVKNSKHEKVLLTLEDGKIIGERR